VPAAAAAVPPPRRPAPGPPHVGGLAAVSPRLRRPPRTPATRPGAQRSSPPVRRPPPTIRRLPPRVSLVPVPLPRESPAPATEESTSPHAGARWGVLPRQFSPSRCPPRASCTVPLVSSAPGTRLHTPSRRPSGPLRGEETLLRGHRGGPMRPLVITQNVTVDGSIEILDDWFDPLDSPPDQHEILQRDSAACDAIVLGRQTFEDFRGFWPEQTDDATGITDELDQLDKYVVLRPLGTEEGLT